MAGVGEVHALDVSRHVRGLEGNQRSLSAVFRVSRHVRGLEGYGIACRRTVNWLACSQARRSTAGERVSSGISR